MIFCPIVLPYSSSGCSQSDSIAATFASLTWQTWHEFNQGITLNSLSWVLNARVMDTFCWYLKQKHYHTKCLRWASSFSLIDKAINYMYPCIMIGFDTASYSDNVRHKYVTSVLRGVWMGAVLSCRHIYHTLGIFVINLTWLNVAWYRSHDDTASRNENWTQCTHVIELFRGYIYIYIWYWLNIYIYIWYWFNYS